MKEAPILPPKAEKTIELPEKEIQHQPILDVIKERQSEASVSVVNMERNSQRSMSKAIQHLKQELSSNLSHKKGRSGRSMPRSVNIQDSGDNDAFRVLRSLEGISNSTKNADGRKPIRKIQTRNKA